MVFEGGAMDLQLSTTYKRNEFPWHTTIRISLDNSYTDFQIITVRDPSTQSFFSPNVSTVTINFPVEMELKLFLPTDEVNEHYTRIRGLSPSSVHIRPSIEGSTYFPYVNTALQLPSVYEFIRRVRILERVIGTNIQVTETELFEKSRDFLSRYSYTSGFKQFGTLSISKPRTYQLKETMVSVYDLFLKNDPWLLYHLVMNSEMSLRELETLPLPIVRVDSGCDIGMLYGDRGCDCHSQFLDVVNNLSHGQLVLHIPAHDGRGFGGVPKALTESLKNGVCLRGWNKRALRLNTVQAAMRIYGNRFDLRTYHGAGMVLYELGLRRKIGLVTDNLRKMEQAGSAGIHVERVPTHTEQKNPHCRDHIIAKHGMRNHYIE